MRHFLYPYSSIHFEALSISKFIHSFYVSIFISNLHHIFIFFNLFFFFSGMWDDDKASGLGTLEYSNGDLYEGEWENDQRNGNEIYNILSFCNY